MNTHVVFWGDSIAQGGFIAFGGIDNAVEGKTLSQILRTHPVNALPENSRVIINIGTNDAVNNATGSNSQDIAIRDARRIIDTAAEMQAAGHNVVVTSLPIALDNFRFGRQGTAQQTEDFQTVSGWMNTEMARYARERGVTFSNVAANPNPGGDGLHLTRSGYQTMYQSVVASLMAGNTAESGAPASSESEAPDQPAEQTEEFTVADVREILSQPITMDTMRQLQAGLGVSVDGKFGPETLGALREFVGDESLGEMSASNWALIARGARDAEGALWIKEQIGDDADLRRAVAGNIASRLGAAEGSLAANQYQSSLSVLGYLDGSKIRTLDEATETAIESARRDYGALIPSVRSTSFANDTEGGGNRELSANFSRISYRAGVGRAISIHHPLQGFSGSAGDYVGNSRNNGRREHEGRDYSIGKGTDIRAGIGGQVVSAGRAGNYGNQVVIVNEELGVMTRYAHIRNGGVNVRVGSSVTADTIIGEVGSTGRSTGPHLHFELALRDGNGNWMIVDPELAYNRNLSNPTVREQLIEASREAYGGLAHQRDRSGNFRQELNSADRYEQIALSI